MSATEPVFVFATNESGHHENAMAQLAMSRWGAQRSRGKGLVGSSYAIPVRNRNNENFSADRTIAEFKAFKDFARDNPQHQFLLSRVGCDDIGFTDEKVAPHFMDCPPNVIIPGVWQRLRNPSHCVFAIVGSPDFDNRDMIEWAMNMTIEFSGKVKEFIVTDDAGVDFVAFHILSERGLPVRTVSIDWEKYGKRAGAIRNREIAFAATHVLLMDEGDHAKCGHMRKTAQSEGLQVYEAKLTLNVGADDTPSDPEMARQKLEEAKQLAQKKSRPSMG